MKIEVVYIFPAFSGDGYVNYAWRYLNSYLACPTAVPHTNIVVCNGGNFDQVPDLLKLLPDCQLFQHDNSGFDCGAYQAVARQSSADLMIFQGVSGFIKGEGWLERIVEVFQRKGTALYGVMGNQGVEAMGVFPHIRTTGFWMPPSLLNDYPMIVSQSSQRYAFEHGHQCLTQWVRNRGLKAWVIGWNAEAELPNWDLIPNGFHRGDQSDLIFGDRLTDPPYYPVNAPRQVPVQGGNRAYA